MLTQAPLIAWATTISDYISQRVDRVSRSRLKVLAGSLAIFYAVNTFGGIHFGPSWLSLLVLLACIAPGISVGIRSLPSPFIVVCASVNFCCVAYLIGMHATYDIGLSGILNSVWLPVLLGVLGFARPTLGCIPATAAFWSKLHTNAVTGLGAPWSADFIIMPDLALYVSLLLSVYWLSKRYRISDAAVLEKSQFFNSAVIVMAGVHLSNYFHSGWLKLFLPGGSLLTWVTENPTFMLAIHASDVGGFTVLNMMQDQDWLVPALVWSNTPLNAFVLVIQLYSLFCLLSLRQSAWLTSLYDIMHFGIFLLTAIFFWKWMILNFAFVYAFSRMRLKDGPTFSIRLFGCALVLVAPLLSFNIVKLAWFDTGAINDAHFEVETASGSILRVPSNFFLEKSINVAQQRIARPVNGFLPTKTWGTVGHDDVRRKLDEACPATASEWDLPTEDLNRISKVVQMHHYRMLGLASADGHPKYNIYPHHIWSAPWLFPDFDNIDLRQVRKYFFVVTSRCVSVTQSGYVSRTDVKTARYEIAL
ncbi:hypothetical protein B5M44_17970 [Shinella sumterensis]|uniref:hypothetical protein n=1 Tax=Shinella sumterensis TaxID=1967501 RepID=UPI00106E4AB5|nr:hypothetical protein [Shinella sumterensis]MCD1267067.1 hypothetical protein [Shinella sumterensis]TFE96786.1 hypothetical protein B5M44_17970 [Shinella sumterensis]